MGESPTLRNQSILRFNIFLNGRFIEVGEQSSLAVQVMIAADLIPTGEAEGLGAGTIEQEIADRLGPGRWCRPGEPGGPSRRGG